MTKRVKIVLLALVLVLLIALLMVSTVQAQDVPLTATPDPMCEEGILLGIRTWCPPQFWDYFVTPMAPAPNNEPEVEATKEPTMKHTTAKKTAKTPELETGDFVVVTLPDQKKVSGVVTSHTGTAYTVLTLDGRCATYHRDRLQKDLSHSGVSPR